MHKGREAWEKVGMGRKRVVTQTFWCLVWCVGRMVFCTFVSIDCRPVNIGRSTATMPSISKRRKQLKTLRERKRERRMERNSVSVPLAPPLPASETTTPSEPEYSKEEHEEVKESLLRWQTAASLRDVHWDEQRTDGESEEESEEELEMTGRG